MTTQILSAQQLDRTPLFFSQAIQKICFPKADSLQKPLEEFDNGELIKLLGNDYLHSTISMCILYTVPFTFSMVQAGRICFTIKRVLSW